MPIPPWSALRFRPLHRRPRFRPLPSSPRFRLLLFLRHPPAPVYQPMGKGIASYYGRELIGARTASGERYDPGALTAAHRSLPMGSHVQVTNAATGQSVIVTINDRGPFHGNRVIDLSQAAARQLGIERAGSGMVSLAVEADD
ncbi:septal ring lytic transglycosylase RlpA family protein [Novosphingobium colocasiae]